MRNDEDIDFDWDGDSPAPGVSGDNFSVKWTRTIDFSSGTYRLYARADDGIRVYVDDSRVIDEWHDSSGGAVYTADRNLSGDTRLRVEYYQHTGDSFVYFWWERLHGTATPTPTPTATATRTPTATPTRAAYCDANPSSGPTGTAVTVSCGGFPANTPVELFLAGYVRAAAAEGGTVYASGSTDRSGNVTLGFTLPAAWPDGAPIPPGKLALLVATTDGRVSAAASYDVTAPRPTVAREPYAEREPADNRSRHPDHGGGGRLPGESPPRRLPGGPGPPG